MAGKVAGDCRVIGGDADFEADIRLGVLPCGK